MFIGTNGYAFYYVSNLNNKVWALYWSGGWQILNLVPSSENVRTDVALKYHDNTIYYVGASSGKLNILSLNGSGVWSGVPVNTSSSVVKINSKLLAYANPIFEEGSNWATFNSANLFYVDNLNTLHYFVFDDSPCTSGWHYHDMVWNTEACKVGGSFPKEWHYGPDPNIELAKTVNPNIRIGQFNKDIYFVDATNKIQILNRTPPINSITFNTNWVLTFSDEFNSLSTTQTKWNPQYPHANNHHFTTKAFNNNYNNLSYNSGIMSIETHEEPSVNTFQGWGKGFFWNDSCFIKHYDYSTTSLQTGCLNCNSNVSPVPQLVNCSGAPLVKEHTFAQKYGWFEIRSKTPRGKGMWNAFWMVPRDMGYTWTNEIDIFEIPGNGKYIAQTNWTDFLPGGGRDNEAKIIDCIGYRAFDDYHTYAVKWTDHDLIFYYDNKPVGSAFTYYIPTASEMFLILSNYTNDQSGSEMMIQSEVQNFPNYWGVDYVRVYAPYIMPKTSLQTESNLNFKVYPVPTKDEITIETPESSFYSLQIYSAEGKLVRELSNLTGTVNLDIKDLLPGIYLFKFQSVEEVSFRKVTVI